MAYSEMAMTDKAEAPTCSRCNRPNAEYRVDMKAVCSLCISLLDRLRLVNKGLFPKDAA